MASNQFFLLLVGLLSWVKRSSTLSQLHQKSRTLVRTTSIGIVFLKTHLVNFSNFSKTADVTISRLNFDFHLEHDQVNFFAKHPVFSLFNLNDKLNFC